jgi:isoquinoline 1-oxidoreductase alpha subunit
MITLNINGQSRHIEADPDTPLLWVLRDDLHLTGTKFGCGRALCGACTVHIDGDATRSCSVMVGAAAGRSIITIEGLSGDVAKAVTDAWIRAAVPQCGYCQPGFVMAVTSVLGTDRKQTKEDVLSQITNLCRCGTYDAIRAAVGFAVADLNPEGEPAKKEGVR